jgi:hypothetical protein
MKGFLKVVGVLCLALVLCRFVRKDPETGGVSVGVATNVSTIRGFTATLTNLEAGYLSYKAGHRTDWWLLDLPKSQQEAESLVNPKTEEISAIIRDYGDVSPLARQVASHFSRFTVSIWINRSQSMAVVGSVGEVRNVPEISFVPKSKVALTGTDFILYWRSDWGLIMHGVNLPSGVFAAFLFHEMGHGVRHPVSPNTIQFAPFSRAYNAEEVEMHILEALVLDRSSHGDYFKKVNEAIASTASPDVAGVFRALTAEHLLGFDDTLGARSTSQHISGMLYVQHVMTVTYLHSLGRGVSPNDEGVKVYDALHSVR